MSISTPAGFKPDRDWTLIPSNGTDRHCGPRLSLFPKKCKQIPPKTNRQRHGGFSSFLLLELVRLAIQKHRRLLDEAIRAKRKQASRTKCPDICSESFGGHPHSDLQREPQGEAPGVSATGSGGQSVSGV